MKRTLYLGNTDDGAVFVWIELTDKDPAGRDRDTTALSINAVEGPTAAGNACGALGRPNAELSSRMTKYAAGWHPDLVDNLAAITERWHLNQLRAGSPAQEEWLREHPVVWAYPDSHYGKALEALAAAGLNPDPNADGYVYGSAWLSEELPAEVVTTLMGFPNGGGRRPPGEWDR